MIDESEQVRPQEDIAYYRLYYSGKQQITGELIQRTNVMLWNKIFKADLVRQYGIDFPTGYEYDDNCFYWQYMCVAKTVCFLDEELYNYLRRNDSVMGKVYNRKNKGVYDSLYSLEHFYDFLRRNSLEKRYNWLLLTFIKIAGVFAQVFWMKGNMPKPIRFLIVSGGYFRQRCRSN